MNCCKGIISFHFTILHSRVIDVDVFFSLFLPGLLITVPIVSDSSTNGQSNDDSSGGGSPDAAGSEEIGTLLYSSVFLPPCPRPIP